MNPWGRSKFLGCLSTTREGRKLAQLQNAELGTTMVAKVDKEFVPEFGLIEK